MDYNAPNTRERIAARRQRRQRPAQASRTPAAFAPGLQATPGPRRSLLGWLSSGRLAGLALCVVACGILAYVFISEEFTIREVRVEGNSALHADDVVELSGVLGWPVWFVPREAVVERLRANAYIASAAVEVALPDVSVIRVVERRPEVRWQAGGVQYLVDGTGKVLGVADAPAEAEVLVVSDSSHHQLAPNEQIDLDAIHLAQALALRLPIDLSFTPAEIGWDYGLGIYVRSTAGQMIVFGQSAQLDRKLAVLKVLLTDQTAFTYLDLRPDNPFYQHVASAPALVPTTAPSP
jgi:cell division protein FtsQ